eukprot:4349173-Pyramimonas_sp.AAC.1
MEDTRETCTGLTIPVVQSRIGMYYSSDRIIDALRHWVCMVLLHTKEKYNAHTASRGTVTRKKSPRLAPVRGPPLLVASSFYICT